MTAAAARQGPDGDFYGVREWNSGDSRRLIHWRGSARLGKDCGAPIRAAAKPGRGRGHGPVAVRRRRPHRHAEYVELAVSFAATVLADACRNGGSNVHLAWSNGKPECVGGAATPALLQGLLEQLAVAEPPSHDTLPELFPQTLQRIDAGTEIVLVTTRPVDLTNARQFAGLWSNPALRDRATASSLHRYLERTIIAIL